MAIQTKWEASLCPEDRLPVYRLRQRIFWWFEDKQTQHTGQFSSPGDKGSSTVLLDLKGSHSFQNAIEGRLQTEPKHVNACNLKSTVVFLLGYVAPPFALQHRA
jgi:hypothetical protein